MADERTITGLEREFHGRTNRRRKKTRTGTSDNTSTKKAAKRKAKKLRGRSKENFVLDKVYDKKTGTYKYVVLNAKGKKAKARKKRKNLRKVYDLAQDGEKFMPDNDESDPDYNAGVEAAKGIEHRVEEAIFYSWKYKKNRPYRKQKKLKRQAKRLNRAEKREEKIQIKKETELRYNSFIKDNPELKNPTLKNEIQKRAQKNRIKKEYAKALRKEKASKAAKEAVETGQKATFAIAKQAEELIRTHASLLTSIGVLLVIILLVMGLLSSCAAMFGQGYSGIMASSYTAVPAEIDAADLGLTQLEMDLQNQVDHIETTYPGYDEYRYNIGAIGHDPFTLISYLTALHSEFTAEEVSEEVAELFDEMYSLTTEEVTETRTRTETRTGTRTVEDEEGNEVTETYTYEEEVQYTVTILEVTLSVTPLETVVVSKMDSDQASLYSLYGLSKGMLQYYYSPLDLYWYNYISSYYGYRVDPVSGENEFHRGLDIAVPTGTVVYAAQDGTVTTAEYHEDYGNYVVIENDEGYVSKYAHLDSLSVSAGQAITHGTQIGTTGNTGRSTGSHLHIECLVNGEYYNPLFYFLAGENTLYGESASGTSPSPSVNPPASYDDEAVQRLMNVATRYIGRAYVWGGSSPSTGFDCSGFVCYSYTQSGVYNLPRTTAQGIYDQCTVVSAADAKPGDIIFFTGTYNSAGAVSHVGIYCGDGVMLHCGDPIGYANVNSSYWSSHFYAYGRLGN